MLCQLVEVGSLRLPASDPPRPMPEPSWTLCGGFIFASQASAYGGDLNRSMQHFILDSKDGVCAMKRKYHRVGFAAAQMAELWDCWQKGEDLKSIGRAFGKSSSPGGRYLGQHNNNNTHRNR